MEVSKILHMNSGVGDKSYAKNSLLQGIVEGEKVDRFNIPNFMPSLEEVRAEVLEEGSFIINELGVSRIDWDFYNTEFDGSNVYVDSSYNIAKCVRFVTEPLMIPHFGEIIVEELFQRYSVAIVKLSSQPQFTWIN